MIERAPDPAASPRRFPLNRREVVLLAIVLGLPTLVFQLTSPVPRLDADAIEYYAHLRSLYFDQDVNFENEFAHFGILSRWDKTNLTPTGYRRTNYSVGPALLWLPFYAVGDLWARGTGDAQEGYSPAYIRSVCLGSWLYGLLGLLLVYGLLKERVLPKVAFWTVFLLLYATFLCWYMVYEPVMSHAPGFFLSALALWLWWNGREGLSGRRAALLGLVIGLATLVRWQNGILLLLPGMSLLLQARRGRGAAFGKGLLLLLTFGVAILPQLLVFKAIFGAYFFPYPIQGRDYLRLDHPFLLETLFSSRHGLLYWTPVLWAGFLGYLPFLRRDPRTALCLIAPLAVMSYVNASSADWWAGGSFGSRRFDSLLPHLALGLAYSLSWLRAAAVRRPWGVLAAGGALLALWNFLFMEQYRRNLIPRDETVSFPRVAENSADMLVGWVGTPLAWPANWIFARRHGLSADRYDLMVGKYLFLRQNNLGGLIDLGDDRADPHLLGEGWTARARCEGAVCRGIAGQARVFAPLDLPQTLDLSVRAYGSGTLSLDVNGVRVGELPLSPAMLELKVRVEAERWRQGLNEILLRLSPGAEASVDLLRFERLPRTAGTD